MLLAVGVQRVPFSCTVGSHTMYACLAERGIRGRSEEPPDPALATLTLVCQLHNMPYV